MTSTMTDKDKGAIARMRAIAELKRRAVDVGVIGAKASATHADAGGMTVADVATIHEFGLGQEERSFIRGYVDESKPKVNALIERMGKAVLSGKITPATGFEALGLKLVGNIQERISNGIKPENRPSTIKAKGSSTTLIDSGQLRSSIISRVVTR